MAHVVAGYPSPHQCVKLMLGMQKLGVGIVEVQIPFSDPIADGEAIMKANDVALANEMSTAKSFDLIIQTRKKGLTTPVYIMSYLQKVVQFGTEDFCARAAECNVRGLIIPDLPFDSDEYKKLSAGAKRFALELVPVISPGMDEGRLQRLLAKNPKLVYLTSIRGITGKSLSVSGELKKMAGEIRAKCPQAELAIGFGVRSANDVREIMRIADIAVVGSLVIREIEKSGLRAGLKFIKTLA